ncbi:MAG: LacI family transcriptional regulator [Clostridium sp.]|jgi:LacI family transcriptional regulator|nr:LacI family transcriptional regulator [Clostridium sp.]
MITIKDIAKEAGVSPTTVSRILNHVQSKVSDEKRKMILDLIEKHNYVPNRSARSLSANSSNIIAILLNAERPAQITGYYPALLRALVLHIQAAGYLPALYYIDRENIGLASLTTWNIDGAILLSDYGERNRLFAARNTPVIFMDSYENDRMASVIRTDDYKAGVLAAGHFLRKGVRDFYFLYSGAIDRAAQEQRLRGLEDSLSEQRLSGRLHEVPADGFQPSALLPGLNGLFLNDITQAQTLGPESAKRCELVCFDELHSPGQAVSIGGLIFQNLDDKAKAAVEILLRQIADKNSAAQRLVMDVFLKPS